MRSSVRRLVLIGILAALPSRAFALLKGEWGLAEGDQRHRVVLNGIWQVGHGFQVSGIHYASAGDRSATSYGADLRNLGAGSGRAAASVLMARSSRATHSHSPRATAPTCACSRRFRCKAAWRST